MGGEGVGHVSQKMDRRLEISYPAVGYSVEKGDAIACENGYRLIE
ncbi:MAG: hypothetical protein SV375_07305 [Thermodesulfobacteriota bacterium]|nr:hypothetical protein [Thermodesulfobacteriota bacterium]